MSTTIVNTFPIILLQGEDRARQEELLADVNRAHYEAADAGPSRAGDPKPEVEARAAYDEFREGAIQRAIHVTLQSVGRKVYGDLLRKHPPREVEAKVTRPDGSVVVEKHPHPEDDGRRFNYSTMGEDLVPECIAEVTSPTPENVPDVKSATKLAAWLDGLPQWAFDLLYERAVELNEQGGLDPKVSLSSLIALTSGVTET